MPDRPSPIGRAATGPRRASSSAAARDRAGCSPERAFPPGAASCASRHRSVRSSDRRSGEPYGHGCPLAEHPAILDAPPDGEERQVEPPRLVGDDEVEDDVAPDDADAVLRPRGTVTDLDPMVD